MVAVVWTIEIPIKLKYASIMKSTLVYACNGKTSAPKSNRQSATFLVNGRTAKWSKVASHMINKRFYRLLCACIWRSQQQSNSWRFNRDDKELWTLYFLSQTYLRLIMRFIHLVMHELHKNRHFPTSTHTIRTLHPVTTCGGTL